MVFFCVFYSILEQGGKTSAIEDIVAKDKAGTVVTDEFFADDEGLCQAIWRRLFGILKVNAVVGAITEQTLEPWQVLRRGDDEDISYAS